LYHKHLQSDLTCSSLTERISSKERVFRQDLAILMLQSLILVFLPFYLLFQPLSFTDYLWVANGLPCLSLLLHFQERQQEAGNLPLYLKRGSLMSRRPLHPVCLL
jgi:hypothetical protein